MMKHPRLPFLKAALMSAILFALLVWQSVLMVQQQLSLGLPLLIAGGCLSLFFVGLETLQSPIGSYTGTLDSLAVLVIVGELVVALFHQSGMGFQPLTGEASIQMWLESFVAGLMLFVSGYLCLCMLLLCLSSICHFRQKDLF